MSAIKNPIPRSFLKEFDAKMKVAAEAMAEASDAMLLYELEQAAKEFMDAKKLRGSPHAAMISYVWRYR